MQFWLSFTFVLFCIHAQVSLAQVNQVVCYFQSWSIYRPGTGYFQVSDIDGNLCTHFIYAYAAINSNAEIIFEDSYVDQDLGGYSQFNGLRDQFPYLKTLISIGGEDSPSETFANIVVNNRSVFADNIVNFISANGFQGIDIDWEYPTENEKSAFVDLLKDLRSRFDDLGYILSVAVSSDVYSIEDGLDIPAITQYVDFFNVMTYDMHGFWDDKTGENSPLYVGPADSTDHEKTQNVDYIMNYYTSQGVPNNKLNVGIGTYGVTFTLENASNNVVGAPATGPGKPGPYLDSEGELSYNEICEMHSAGQFTEQWNGEQNSSYAYSDDQWVGYDNIDAVKIKAQYANDGNYGIVVWSIDMDDFRNTCGDGNYPLLNIINQNINL